MGSTHTHTLQPAASCRIAMVPRSSIEPICYAHSATYRARPHIPSLGAHHNVGVTLEKEAFRRGLDVSGCGGTIDSSTQQPLITNKKQRETGGPLASHVCAPKVTGNRPVEQRRLIGVPVAHWGPRRSSGSPSGREKNFVDQPTKSNAVDSPVPLGARAFQPAAAPLSPLPQEVAVRVPLLCLGLQPPNLDRGSHLLRRCTHL